MDHTNRSLVLSDFKYDLPDDRIARYPLTPRDSSRLLVYKQGCIHHSRFDQLAGQIPGRTLLVFNDTRVIPARSHFQKESGAVIEILFLHPEAPTRIINDAMLVRKTCVWECMIGNKKRWKSDEMLTKTIAISDEEILIKVSYADFEKNRVQITWGSDHTFLEIIQVLGQIPLPPYLKRETEQNDVSTYQTVYANHEGAVAAPTAGLHFTENVFKSLREKGIHRSFLTLHVGAGTFQPIKTEIVTEHNMHCEQVVYSRKLISDLQEYSGNIIPVGTTSMRSLESLYWFGVKLLKDTDANFRIEKLYPYSIDEPEAPPVTEALESIAAYMQERGMDELTGETEIFIMPGYRFRLCDALITNYHQPGSTLMLLVAAFTGANWRRIYDEALEKNYRFLSYGDSSLLWKDDGSQKA